MASLWMARPGHSQHPSSARRSAAEERAYFHAVRSSAGKHARLQALPASQCCPRQQARACASGIASLSVFGTLLFLSLTPSAKHHHVPRSTRIFASLEPSPSSATPAAAMSADSTSADARVDVAVIGAGIIGLGVALEVLRCEPSVRVALVDRKGPCSGATGAGQGYIWMGHRQPGSALWELAKHSRETWEHSWLPLLTQGIGDQGNTDIGWRKTGSLLFASNESQNDRLREHVAKLQGACVHAHLLTTPEELRQAEPALGVPPGCYAAEMPEDCQIDAKLAVAAILKVLRSYGDRYLELFEEEVVSFARLEGQSMELATKKRTIVAEIGAVVCTGAWSSSFMATALSSFSALHDVIPRVFPRKGYLIEVCGAPLEEPLQHGVMEFEYTANYASTLTPAPQQQQQQQQPQKQQQAPALHPLPPCSSSSQPATFPAIPTPPGSAPPVVTMTATVDHHGCLLIGSSREFSGFDSAIDDTVVRSILSKAALFLPSLLPLAAAPSLPSNVRVGLRPYVPDGRPVIGALPGMPGVVFALGHEGSGLTLAPGTAALVLSGLFSRATPLDPAPFLPTGRLTSLANIDS